MRPVTARQVRALRAVAASSLTTLFAATAHTLGGGGAPSPAVLVIAVALSMPVALVLNGPKAGPVGTAAAVVGSQAVYHAVFAVFGMSLAFTGLAVHLHDAMTVGMPAASSGTSTMDAGAPMMGLFEPSMLAMHAVAAIATLVVLRHGERLLRGIFGLIWPALLRRMFRPLSVRPARTLAVRSATPVLRALLSGVRRRGPPITV